MYSKIKATVETDVQFSYIDYEEKNQRKKQKLNESHEALKDRDLLRRLGHIALNSNLNI